MPPPSSSLPRGPLAHTPVWSVQGVGTHELLAQA
jgi:hypothetical protein